MTEDEMKRELYRLYQLDWMMSHHASLDDVFHGLYDATEDLDSCNSPGVNLSLEIDSFYDQGFDGNIFACYEEFCDAELNDKDYVNALVDCLPLKEQKKVLQAYQKYLEEEAS